MKIVFMGSGRFACPLLKALLDAADVQVCAVVTAPDRPAGRGKTLQPSPVKWLAAEYGAKILMPEDANAPDFLTGLQALAPDVLVVSDYGQFLRPPLLALAPLGAINVHPSLLPKYRGASPIQWALANGEDQTGVCVLRVTPRMDAGNILAVEETAILHTEDAPALSERLARIGARLLLETLRAMAAGTHTETPQDEAHVTFARRLTKEDARVDWQKNATQIRNQLRGFSPWPGATAILPNGNPLKLLAVEVAGPPAPDAAAAPGTILTVEGEGPRVACGGNTCLCITRLQPAGKRPMSGAEFIRGRGLQPGALLQ